MTPKQRAFADFYIECGNATEAAKRAGYCKKTARVMGQENLLKPVVSEYIAERIKPTEQKRIADADEVMQFYTAVMRGEVKDQFGLDVAISDKIKAGVELMKRFAVAENRAGKQDGMLADLIDGLKDEE